MLAHVLPLLAALLLALCAGAVWSVATVLSGNQAPWMALPAAALAVFACSSLRSRAWRALTAFLCTLISAVYAWVLAAASVVSSSLAVPFGESLLGIGPEMALAIASARTGPLAASFVLAVALAAGAVAWKWPRQAQEMAPPVA